MSSGWATKALAVLAKDIRTELRTRYSLNALFMFAFTTLVVISFSLGQLGLSAQVLSALYWIIIFFSAMSALAGVFVKEEDTKTAQTLRLFARPSVIYAGKLIYNMLLLAIPVRPANAFVRNLYERHRARLVAVYGCDCVGDNRPGRGDNDYRRDRRQGECTRCVICGVVVSGSIAFIGGGNGRHQCGIGGGRLGGSGKSP